MKCEFCFDGKLVDCLVAYERRDVRVEKTPARKCNNCGEVFYDKEVLNKIAQANEDCEYNDIGKPKMTKRNWR